MGSLYYGAVFISDFLGTYGAKVVTLDNGTRVVVMYVFYSAVGSPLCLLILDSNYFDRSTTRVSQSVQLGGLMRASGTVRCGRRG